MKTWLKNNWSSLTFSTVVITVIIICSGISVIQTAETIGWVDSEIKSKGFDIVVADIKSPSVIIHCNYTEFEHHLLESREWKNTTVYYTGEGKLGQWIVFNEGITIAYSYQPEY